MTREAALGRGQGKDVNRLMVRNRNLASAAACLTALAATAASPASAQPIDLLRPPASTAPASNIAPPSPPPPPVASPLPAPAEPMVTYALLPGHWKLDGWRYVWVPPETVPRPVEYRRLIQGRYVWRGREWVWVPTHWEE